MVSQQLDTTFTPEQVDALIAEDLVLGGGLTSRCWAIWRSCLAAGYPLGCCPISRWSWRRFSVRKPWLQHFAFHHLVLRSGCGEAGCGHFQHAAEQMGVPVEELTFIDDTQENCDGAAIAGLRRICLWGGRVA
ncbi:MAG: hypothetical protein U1U88_001496 [Lawsonella clevelandensis]